MDERAFISGQQCAYREMLGVCLRGIDAPPTERLQLERSAAVAMLRSVCAEHGDNDWPDNLHLADVIEKHLWRYLDDNDERKDEL